MTKDGNTLLFVEEKNKNIQRYERYLKCEDKFYENHEKMVQEMYEKHVKSQKRI